MAVNRQPDQSPVFRFSPAPNRANEINWHPWESIAFAAARQEGKPVFLAISAFWCHWCHVMDETTYSDSSVIELLNTEYMPIRIDTDERPDINRRYNQGGWPSFAILAPSGEILIGGTYITPNELKKLLAQVRAYYATHRGEIQQKVEEAQREWEEIEAKAVPVGVISERIVSDTLDFLKKAYDQTYGGFNKSPKFPQSDAFEFLLDIYYRTKEASWLEMVLNSLDHMMESALFDRVNGGFFRYAATRDWSAPHYEKMLQENAELITLYLRAYLATENARYEQVALRTMNYLSSTLRDPNTGCFRGSQDAEEEYYLLPKEQRQGRKAPFVDPIIYTDWNAMAATAFLTAYRVLGDEESLRQALQILDFLWSNCRHEGRGMYHYWDGRPNFLGFLPDQIYTARAMLDAYQSTGKMIYLQRAEKLAELIRRDFFDREGTGFFDTAMAQIVEAPPGLHAEDKSILDNSEVADLFLALYVLTGEEDYHSMAEQALRAFLNDYQQYGLFSSSYADAVELFLHEPVRITIVGRRQQAGTQKLLKESLKTYSPATVIEILDTERDAQKIENLGYGVGPVPAAYVCHKKTCAAPVVSAEDLRPTVDSLL